MSLWPISRGRGEMADAADLKSAGRKAVRVQFPPPAPHVLAQRAGWNRPVERGTQRVIRRISNGQTPGGIASDNDPLKTTAHAEFIHMQESGFYAFSTRS